MGLAESIYSGLGLNDGDIVIIYGEWCGRKIQKGVAVANIDPIFMIFDVRVEPFGSTDSYWVDDSIVKSLRNHEKMIYNAYDFGLWTIDIDFNNPKAVQNQLVEYTNQVEKECPIGKHFGELGVGEGIVWSYHMDPETKIRFKVKGEKHSVTKKKTLAPVDVEKVSSINEFIDQTVTEARLEQAIEYVFTQNNLEPDKKHLGKFLKWVVDDIRKEDSDTLEASGLTIKDVGKGISNKSRTWFFKNYS
jgi:hypothetical protein